MAIPYGYAATLKDIEDGREQGRKQGRLAALREVREIVDGYEKRNHMRYADSYTEGARDVADNILQDIDAMIAREEQPKGERE